MQSSPSRCHALQKGGEVVRATICLMGALLSFGVMLALGFFALVYLRGGAGIELLAFSVSPPGALVGMLHVLGLLFAAAICFCVGVALFAYALVPPEPKE